MDSMRIGTQHSHVMGATVAMERSQTTIFLYSFTWLKLGRVHNLEPPEDGSGTTLDQNP